MKVLIKNKVTEDWDLVNEHVLANQKFIEEYSGQATVSIKPGQEFEVRGVLTGQDISNEPEVVKIVRGNS